jgi:hypothetical protein
MRPLSQHEHLAVNDNLGATGHITQQEIPQMPQSEAEKQYLAEFANMPLEERRLHFALILAFVRDLRLYGKETATYLMQTRLAAQQYQLTGDTTNE